MRSRPRLLKRTPIVRFLFVALFVVGGLKVRAQSESQPNPLNTKPWSIGVFGTGGIPLNYRFEFLTVTSNGGSSISAPITMQILSAGVHIGTVLTEPHGPAFLRGQYEMGGDLMPLWLAHIPSQSLVFNNGLRTEKLNSESRFGISFTPLLCRWNFVTRRRVMPWIQLGGGLLWTNHKFPQYPDRQDDTSVINFTPQAGLGFHLFLKAHRSLFFQANAVHISSGGLGDDNPGINLTAQFTLGYSWWK